VKGEGSASSILLEKIREQVGLTHHLISLIPASAIEWRPETLTTSALDDSGQRLPANSAERIQAVPGDQPNGPGMDSDTRLLSIGDLMGHLLDCMGGFCAVLHSANSSRLPHFQKLRDLPVNHFCQAEEARARIRDYMAHIEEGFAILDDADLCRLLPTVFTPAGEAVLTLLLGNLEHLINHKYQLFIYLRLLGVPVGTKDLYRIRGDANGG